MEQKKVLWIVAALGIFLLVIFLGTLIIYSPQQQPQMVGTETSLVQNDAWINPQNVPLTPQDNGENKETKIDDVDIVDSEMLTNTGELIQTGDVTVISQGKTTVYSQDGITTIDLTAAQKESETGNNKQDEPTVRPIATRVPSSNAKEPEVTRQPSTASTQPAAAKKIVTPAPVEQYWVQAASFVSKSNADNARATLITQKIPAEVFTYADEDGVTFYRVRVGPYTTKSEAEYWNSYIQSIDTFMDTKSYVTNSKKPA